MIIAATCPEFQIRVGHIRRQVGSDKIDQEDFNGSENEREWVRVRMAKEIRKGLMNCRHSKSVKFATKHRNDYFSQKDHICANFWQIAQLY